MNYRCGGRGNPKPGRRSSFEPFRHPERPHGTGIKWEIERGNISIMASVGEDNPMSHEWPGIRPAAPFPRERPQGLIELLLTLNRNPLEAWTKAHFEEEIIAGESPLGRFAIVNAPDAIRTVLVENAEDFPKDNLQKRLLKPALGNGLLTADGDAWRVQRKQFAPSFAPRKIVSHLPSIQSEALALVARWRRFRQGQPLDVAEEMARTMLNMLARTLFPDGIGRPPAEFREAATRYFETQGRVDPLDLVGAPDWLPRIGRFLSRPALEFFPKVVDAMLRDHGRDASASRDGDLLSRFVGSGHGDAAPLSDADIAANVITFIGAGFETPANALSWALYLLSLDDDWRRKIETEADDLLADGEWPAAGIEPFVATRALIDEAMRLYPPVAIMTRRAARECVLAGRRIQRNATIIISPWIIHRHRRLWSNPDEFDPSRFAPEHRLEIGRYSYLPFGAGPRVCIGSAFAMQQMIVTLATIARHFRLVLAPSHRVVPVHRVTLRPEGGMIMTIRSR
jgi:cytochrome P450